MPNKRCYVCAKFYVQVCLWRCVRVAWNNLSIPLNWVMLLQSRSISEPCEPQGWINQSGFPQGNLQLCFMQARHNSYCRKTKIPTYCSAIRKADIKGNDIMFNLTVPQMVLLKAPIRNCFGSLNNFSANYALIEWIKSVVEETFIILCGGGQFTQLLCTGKFSDLLCSVFSSVSQSSLLLCINLQFRTINRCTKDESVPVLSFMTQSRMISSDLTHKVKWDIIYSVTDWSIPAVLQFPSLMSCNLCLEARGIQWTNSLQMLWMV